MSPHPACPACQACHPPAGTRTTTAKHSRWPSEGAAVPRPPRPCGGGFPACMNDKDDARCAGWGAGRGRRGAGALARTAVQSGEALDINTSCRRAAPRPRGPALRRQLQLQQRPPPPAAGAWYYGCPNLARPGPRPMADRHANRVDWRRVAALGQEQAVFAGGMLLPRVDPAHWLRARWPISARHSSPPANRRPGLPFRECYRAH